MEDPLGGYCVASHIWDGKWSVIKGKFKTKKEAQDWLNNYTK